MKQLDPNKGRLLRRLWDNKILMLMCVPAVTFFIVFAYIPMPGAYVAFTRFNFREGIFNSPFVGFDNFRFLIIGGQLWQLTRNTLLYNIAFIALGTCLQITMAILMNEIRLKSFKKVTQTIMFLPHFISAVLVGFLAFSILNYDYGFLPNLIRGFGGEAPQFYNTPRAWPFIIVLVHLWQSTGLGSIVYFAAIMGIDPTIYEAAAIDGANALQRIRYIILPSLKRTAIILILFAIGGILRGNFALFFNLVGTTNAALFPYTDIIETFVFRALLTGFNFENAAAVGLYQSVVGFILVFGSNWLVKRYEKDYALF